MGLLTRPPFANVLPSALVARLSGRALWEARRSDGRIFREADGIDWMDLPKRGLVDLSLVAPDGTGRGFGNTGDATGRLFQFKGATLTAGMGGGGAGRTLNFHLIGMLQDVRGKCVLWIYEHDRQRWAGPLEDNFYDLKYRQLGALNPDLLI